MLKYAIKSYEEIGMIGEIFVKNKINFLYGESGVGKTVSTIKAINKDNIEPILLDFDDNLSPKINECKYIHIDGYAFIDGYINSSNVELPKDEVVVIDTYIMFEPVMNKLLELDIDLIELLIQNKNTLVLIGHNKDLATRRDIPDAPSEFVNHCASKLFVSRQKNPITKVVQPTLTVMKLRGYSGSREIYNWMR